MIKITDNQVEIRNEKSAHVKLPAGFPLANCSNIYAEGDEVTYNYIDTKNNINETYKLIYKNGALRRM